MHCGAIECDDRPVLLLQGSGKRALRILSLLQLLGVRPLDSESALDTRPGLQRAAAGGCPLLQLGELEAQKRVGLRVHWVAARLFRFLPVPGPRYLSEQDWCKLLPASKCSKDCKSHSCRTKCLLLPARPCLKSDLQLRRLSAEERVHASNMDRLCYALDLATSIHHSYIPHTCMLVRNMTPDTMHLTTIPRPDNSNSDRERESECVCVRAKARMTQIISLAKPTC